MIRVDIKEPSKNFEQKVARPGAKLLAKLPRPISKEDRRKLTNYWSQNGMTEEISETYGHTCAYTATYLETGRTIDHYHARDLHPELAYEWSNLRVCASEFNGAKKNNTQIPDPFKVKKGWFQLNLKTLDVEPGPTLPVEEKENAKTLCRLLQAPVFRRSRRRWTTQYAEREVTFKFLRQQVPFLAQELDRQGYQDQPEEIPFIQNTR